jgi:arsenate reductase (glutaredoxin)
MIVYGIKNCNTVKSAVNWLKQHHISFEFHDYKTQKISPDKLRDWCKQLGWERLVNKRGATWRQLSEQDQSSICDESTAIAMMLAKTSLIKRPLLEREGKVLTIGFHEGDYAEMFK